MAKDTSIDLLTYGFISASINVLFILSILGLFIKIYRYDNKDHFLNS